MPLVQLSFALLALLAGRSHGAPPVQAGSPTALQPRIDAAIERGVDYLLSMQGRDGSFPGHQPAYPRGTTALSAYALRHAGLAPEHPAIRKALAFVEAHPPTSVYAVGCELLLLESLGPLADRSRVEQLLEQLLDWQGPNGWGYPAGEADLSNVHYAMFGMASAEKLGVETSRKDWERARKAVLRFLDGDSDAPISGSVDPPVGFVYRPRDTEPRSSLTAVGAALLALTLNSESARVGSRARAENERSVARAKAWLDANWRVDTNVGSGNFQYYHLLAVERAAVLCGWEEIAGLPWYETGATWLLEAQRDDGGWNQGSGGEVQSALSDTAFAILFLRRAARGIATGTSAPAGGILRADDPAGQVHLALRDQRPVRAWVTGFGLGARAVLGADALRVARVEYLMDGELVATVEGGGGAPWDDEQFVGLLTPVQRGPLEVRARVVLADEAGQPSGKQLLSEPLSITIDELEETWALEFARLQAENRIAEGEPSIRASSSNGPDPPQRAIDGMEGTWWLCEAGDEVPVLRIEFGETVRASELWVSPADGMRSGLGRFDRILELAVTVDGVREPFVVSAPDDPLSPLRLDFGKRRHIDVLELAITRREPATVAPGLAGFNELILR